MIHHIRQAARHVLVWAMYCSGFTWWLARRRLRGRVLVLTYHRVLPDEMQRDSFSSHSIVVSPRTFERQLRFLRQHFRMLTLDEFVAAATGGKSLPARSCLVTFDDGWFDNLQYAEPILARQQVPAAVFVATDFVGTQKCFWQERFGRLLHRCWQTGSGAALLADLGASTAPDLHDHEATRTEIRNVIDRLKHRPPEEISALVEGLASEVATRDGADSQHPDRFMSWEEVATLGASRFVTVSSHAHSHRPLTELTRDEIATELQQSRREIEQRLGGRVTTIAYPNGNHDDAVVATAAACGYVAGFTTIPGRHAPGEDPLRVKRVNMSEKGARSAPGFLARVIGLM